MIYKIIHDEADSVILEQESEYRILYQSNHEMYLPRAAYNAVERLTPEHFAIQREIHRNRPFRNVIHESPEHFLVSIRPHRIAYLTQGAAVAPVAYDVPVYVEPSDLDLIRKQYAYQKYNKGVNHV